MAEPPSNPDEEMREQPGECPEQGDKRPRKATNAVVMQRIEEVLRVRLDGAQYHDIQQYSAEKGWNLSERQLREYMARADNLLVERLDKKRKPVIARHIAQRQSLFARAVNASDLRTALAILDSEAKLRSLFPEREVKELLSLLGAQNTRIEELERRLASARHDQEAASPAIPEAGPA